MKQQELDSKIIQLIKIFRIAVLVSGAAILFYACQDNKLDTIKALSSPENLPIQEVTKFHTISTDSGVIRYSLKAPKLLRFENSGQNHIEFPKGMELIKYDAQKQITSSISANYAKQFVKEAKWEAKNNVVVTNANGDSLKTEHLIWEEKSEKIYTEEFVKIIRPDQIITGIGLVSDQNMLNWKVKNPKGVIYLATENNSETPLNGTNSTSPPQREEQKTIQLER